MMCYRERKRREYLLRGLPVKGTDREIIVLTLPYGQLLSEVDKREELMRSIELLIVLAVAAFNLTIVPGSEWTDELVADSQISQSFLEQRGFLDPIGAKMVGKFWSVVGLDAFNGIGEASDNMLYELGGRIGTVFLESLQIAKTAVLIKESILVELFVGGFSHKAG